MKRLVVVMLFAVLLLTACTPTGSPLPTDLSEPTQSTSKEDIAPTPSTTVTTTTTTTTTQAETPGIGTRKNPSPFGETRTVYGELYDGTYLEYTITLSNLRRGKEAEGIALSNNMFNTVPAGQEAIVFDVEFHLVQYSPDDDDYYWVSDYDFDYYDSSYSSFKGEPMVGGDNEFGGKLYEGGKAIGDVIMCIPEGDQGYILFEDLVWFKLP